MCKTPSIVAMDVKAGSSQSNGHTHSPQTLSIPILHRYISIKSKYVFSVIQFSLRFYKLQSLSKALLTEQDFIC